jgi:hypothetical protein
MPATSAKGAEATLGVFFEANLYTDVRDDSFKKCGEEQKKFIHENRVRMVGKNSCLKKSCSRACLALIRFFGSISRHREAKSKSTLQTHINTEHVEANSVELWCRGDSLVVRVLLIRSGNGKLNKTMRKTQLQTDFRD